jgi:hypothetical protein
MAPADNTAALAEATRRRSQQARAHAEKAITNAQRTGRPATIAGLAHTAGVSRSWLYTQTDLITAIRQLQQRHPAATRTGQQPATPASIHRRLDTALARIKQLRADNTELTRQLEAAHGEIRRLRSQGPPSS